mgnify:CR=1 FL=1
MRDRCINSYTQWYSSWPHSGLRRRTCPNAARCGRQPAIQQGQLREEHRTLRAGAGGRTGVVRGDLQPRQRPSTKAERFDKAEQTMRRAAADSLRTDGERAEAFYNLGNAQFKQQKYKEALESYKPVAAAETLPTSRPSTTTPTPSGCSTRTRTAEAATTSRTRIRIRTRIGTSRGSRIRSRDRDGRTRSRGSRTGRIPGRTETRSSSPRNPTRGSRATHRVRRSRLRASRRRSRSRFSTPSRPRRTRRRRNSRRNGASWSAAGRTGKKTKRPCNSHHPIICGCSRCSRR